MIKTSRLKVTLKDTLRLETAFTANRTDFETCFEALIAIVYSRQVGPGWYVK